MNVSPAAIATLYTVPLGNQPDPVTRNKDIHASVGPDLKPAKSANAGETPGHLNIKA